MRNFQEIRNDAEQKFCAFCSRRQEAGKAVLIIATGAVVCDAECEMKFKQRTRAVQSFSRQHATFR